MAEHTEFVPVDEEAQPTEESIQTAQAEGSAETRPCDLCQDEVSIGERVLVLTEDGQAWRHPWHV